MWEDKETPTIIVKKWQDNMRDTQLQDVKGLKMRYPWKASSFLLPWQRSLLGNSVAMARVSSVMQTWPHPPAPHQLWRAGRLYYWLSVCICVCERDHVLSLFILFLLLDLFLKAANFILHGSLHWPIAPLLFRGASPLLGLEWTWNVWRWVTHRHRSATAGFCPQTSSDWLWSRTLFGSVRCRNRLWKQTLHLTPL